MADVENVKPHKFANALGTGSIYGLVTAIPVTIISYMRGMRVLANFNDASYGRYIRSPVTLALAIAPAAAAIFGAFKGWKNATKEENYINDLEQQNIALGTQNTGLITQVEGLNNEVAAGRKSFVEMHAKHTAEKGVLATEKGDLAKQLAEKAAEHAAHQQAAHAAHAEGEHAAHAQAEHAHNAAHVEGEHANHPAHAEGEYASHAEHAAHAEGAHANHADAHSSRAEHGSHAEAHLAAKENAAHTEAARA